MAQDAVADVIGNILIVAITVSMMSAVGLLVLNQPPPLNEEHADLSLSLGRGDGMWGNGNELVLIDHLGGEQLTQGDALIVVRQGSTTSEYRGAALGAAFADGAFIIGETWSQTFPIPANTEIAIDVFSGQALVATAVLNSVFSCANDIAGPIASLWLQGPADVRITTLGSVTVDVTLVDDCSGVDAATDPHLWSALDDGIPPEEAFVDRGAMVLQGGTTWRGTVPDPAWAIQGGKSLKYYVTGQLDLDTPPNLGTTTKQTDLVNVISTSPYYVFAKNDLTGTTANFTNAQSAADSGAESELKEAGSAPPTTNAYNANVVVSAGSWGASTNVYTSNDAYSTTSTNNAFGRWGFADEAGNPGTITQVVLKAEVSITVFINDQFTLQVCNASICSTESAGILGSASDITITYDVTGLNPNGGAWQFSQVSAIEGRVKSLPVAAKDGTWRIDRFWVEVTYTPPTTYTGSVEMTWQGVPVSAAHYLDLKYRTVGDSFKVFVWNGAAWTDRGTLAADTSGNFTYLLAALEYSAVNPNAKIRFDGQTTSTTQGKLYLDFARVVNG